MMMLNFDFVLRLLVAGILGAIIGLDREYRAKEAGYRTHFLVSLGSALIMIVSQYGFQEIIKESSVTLDPSRVAAQVVSGIGFIGAGTIIFQKQKDANPWLRDTSLMNKSGRTYILKIPTQAGMHYNPKKTVPHNKNWVIN